MSSTADEGFGVAAGAGLTAPNPPKLKGEEDEVEAAGSEGVKPPPTGADDDDALGTLSENEPAAGGANVGGLG
jgi:hypothetical protein